MIRGTLHGKHLILSTRKFLPRDKALFGGGIGD
jgi:hypothetical protein